jgi:hypothetical protein
VSARMRARSTAKADGLDASRALQRVLYRGAKQQPQRRFHARFDKVARGADGCWTPTSGTASGPSTTTPSWPRWPGESVTGGS